MLAELSSVLSAVPPEGCRRDYAEAVIEGNCLRKPTTSTRRLSLQRLSELYALDLEIPLFRILRRLWDDEPTSRPLLALLAALARDPLLMATAQAIVPLADATLDKVIRNAASSWSQSGHLSGRTFKIRRRVQPTPRALAFALYLGVGSGFRGEELLSSGWVKTLDCSPSQALNLAIEAKRLGLLDLRVAGDVFDLSLERLDPRVAGGVR